MISAEISSSVPGIESPVQWVGTWFYSVTPNAPAVGKTGAGTGTESRRCSQACAAGTGKVTSILPCKRTYPTEGYFEYVLPDDEIALRR